MEGSDSEFAHFTLPTLKTFLEAHSQKVSGNKQKLVAHAIGCPKPHFFHELAIFRTAKKQCKEISPPTLALLPPVIFATAAVVAFVLLRNSRLNFPCYTQREGKPTQKSAQKWCCDLSRLLAQKITKGIHSCKPALLNHPISTVQLLARTWNAFVCVCACVCVCVFMLYALNFDNMYY